MEQLRGADSIKVELGDATRRAAPESKGRARRETRERRRAQILTERLKNLQSRRHAAMPTHTTEDPRGTHTHAPPAKAKQNTRTHIRDA